MKSTLISKDKNLVKFTIEFTAEEFEQAQIKAYQKAKGQFNIDGFRKGKAPRSIIEKKYGEGIFWDDAIDTLLQTGYPDAVKELELEVIDYPKLESFTPKKGESLVIPVAVEVYPEVEVKDYFGVEIDKVEAEVTDEDVDNEIALLQKRNSRMIVVDRPVQDKDTVLIDYMGFVGDEQFEGGTAERYPLKVGSGTFIPGFEEQLIGAKAGDDVEVKVTFPEDYHAEDLAGREAVFKCKVHEIKEEEIPELDDEFVKDVSEFDTVDELKASKREELEKSAKEEAETQMKDQVLGKIYDANDIDVPDVMVETEIDSLVNEFDQQLRAQGMSLDLYCEYLGKKPEEFRDEVKDDAFKKVKTRMIVSAIAEKEAIEANDEEVDAEIENMAKMYQMEADQIRNIVGEENIAYMKKDIRNRKAVDLVYEKAVIK
ncbi:MAG: trigger factor [Clostridiales bacterium]|nr:trigger factor [Clostridiales bacterium]MDD6390570.1 trigger factor [Bacillota bacterium]MDY5975693.1 trigger factor [Anaerovoracaceae bacterium]